VAVLRSVQRALGPGVETLGSVLEVACEHHWRADAAGLVDDAGGAESLASVLDGVAGELLAGFDGAAGGAGQLARPGSLDRARRHPGAPRSLWDGQLGEPNDLHHEIPKRILPSPGVAVTAVRFGLAEPREVFFEGVHLVRAHVRALR
jgi:hypothetical protein